MITGYFEKTVVERFTFAILYEGRLPASATLVSATVICTLANTGVTDNGLLGSTTATISGDQAKVVVLAGTASQDYFLTFTATLSDSSILEDTVLLKVAA